MKLISLGQNGSVAIFEVFSEEGVKGPRKKFVRGCEKFLSALA